MLSIKRFLVLLLCFLPAAGIFAAEKQAIGWVEKVTIDNSDFKLKAKIDTGATTTSVSAKILKKFVRNGENWMRFQIEDEKNNKLILERRVLKYVKIKRKLIFSIKRPVITLGICIGNVYRKEEVNLSDRKNFIYPALIGRNFLKGYFLVDSEKKFTVKPGCKF